MLSIKQIVEATKGQLVCSDNFNSDDNFFKNIYCSEQSGESDESFNIVIDSRLVKKNDIFIAIVGENKDGHDYVPCAVEKGASLIIVSDKNSITSDCNFLLVKDTVLALGQIAKYHLQTLKVKTIGITGSAGKTTTKDLLAQVLSKKFGKNHIVYPEGSFNNEIGMPLTVLKANESTEFLILEMGASGIGHLKYLTGIAPLDYAIVLFVGHAHLSGFGSIEGVATAKSELVQGLKPTGVAILNLDDENVCKMSKYAPGRTIFYSAKGVFSDVWAENVKLIDNHPDFDLFTPAGTAHVKLKLLGKHNVTNALAVAALLNELGEEVSEISQYLQDSKILSKHRLNIQTLSNGCVIIDDSYNANPDSMKAGITCLMDVAKSYKHKGMHRTIAVLGQMLELGPQSDEIHKQLAFYINKLPLDVAFVVGKYAKPLADNLTVKKVYYADNIQGVENELSDYLCSNDIVLFKGSNGSKVWQLADRALKGGF